MIRTSIRGGLALLAVLALGFGAAACGDDDSESSTPAAASTATTASGTPSAEEKAANKIQPVQGASSIAFKIGSKNFAEQYVLAEIYTQAFDAAGYKVTKDLDIGSEVVAHKALTSGAVDAYPEYTGTSLTAFFDKTTDEVPKDAGEAYDQAKAAYAEEDITAYPPTPFENSYRLGVTKAEAAKLGDPTTMSDLQDKASTLTITGYPECRQRKDCLIGVQDTYDMKFKKFLPGTTPYQALDNGDAQVAFIFTTDGELASGKYVVLDDDKNFFPPYNVSLGMRDDVAKKLGTDGENIVTSVQKYLTEDVMTELNARVVVDKDEPADVAADYLKSFGFTS
jgi:glycine betaine/choline ABC-type transport system substrate-binding protein